MPTLKFKITLSSYTASKWRIQGYIPNLCDFRVLVMCLIPLRNHGKPTFQKNNAFRQKRNCKWVNKDALTWSRIGSIMEYFYFGCFCFLHGALGQQMHPFFTCEVPTPLTTTSCWWYLTCTVLSAVQRRGNTACSFSLSVLSSP